MLFFRPGSVLRQALLLLVFPVWQIGQAQSLFTLSGTVADSLSGETLIGASVVLSDRPDVGTTCNEYGFFAMRLPAGEQRIRVVMLGYIPFERTVELHGDVRMELLLRNTATELKAVDVIGEGSKEALQAPRMGIEKLDVREIAKVPVLFGEKDVLKTLQLFPGVKSLGEGNGGLYVRGGAADENLILLDEAPVYNAYHLLGFFSTFNSDAIKDVTLYKGTAPAQYGGRLSSVIDVRMNEGNDKHFHASGGLGIISSRLNVEGPIVKDRGSFLITARRTYADLFLKLSNNHNLNNNTLYFYDINAKASYKLGGKDRIFLSGYFGRDVLGLNSRFGIDWGNSTGTLRWNHLYGARLFSNTSIIYSNFSYNVSVTRPNSDFSLLSRIRDVGLKHDFSYYASTRHTLHFGFEFTHHTIVPGQAHITGTTTAPVVTLQDRYGLQSAVYLSDEWKAGARLQVSAGVRFAMFNQMGGGDFFSYDAAGNVTDTTHYAAGKIVATYINPEPRLTFSYALTEHSALKIGYARNTQVMHLISNTTSTNPTDVWMMSSKNIKPRIADQVSLGWSRTLEKIGCELNIETYYKTTQNAIDLRNGADLRANELLEGSLLYGTGRAYGLEVLLRRRTGRLTGWIGYTLARTELRFTGINKGAWYPAKQDDTHDVSVVGMYDLSDKWSLSATWVYHTGNAVTFPSGKYIADGQVQFLYTERNGYRMPAYHRLDLAATWNHKRTGRYTDSWTFSCYNAYGRENAYSIDFQQDPNDASKTQAVQTTLFRWVPSITYNFNF